ncbi:amidase [Rhodoplanes sp. Z2-YC6860]|uniref:amidase n=1 Tax=Rhodoplanes sp. Z2-YC6860 TaxID=674703 RepID=UPI0018DB4C44|nr:amidase [Rhodoplanes sp. Z2-YC6860]
MSGSVWQGLMEASVDSMLAAYQARETDVRSVVRAYLDRIEAYDRRGPALWSLIAVNPDVMKEAEALDRAFAASGKLSGPLHGVPALIKDNVDVAGLPTTGGSRALAGWLPPRDATLVTKLRAAGAIILAKTTMSEFARGGIDNINSVLPGFARNPYNTAHATGGSSGGTGAALAANFGTIGIGSDTWGSIRNPSSNNAIVGLRPSRALVSRHGMMGLYDARDTVGPMARTVADLVALLDVIAGVDPEDPATAGAAGKIPPTFKTCLKANGANRKRIGVLRQAFPPGGSDPAVTALLDRAVADLRSLGAEIVDPLVVPEFDDHPARPHPQSEVRATLEKYLAKTGPGYPKTVADVMASQKFHPLHEAGLIAASTAPNPNEDPAVKKLEADEIRMREAYERAMTGAGVDFLVMPCASFPPKLNGDRNTTPAGSTTWIASGLHWPAIIVPMGYSHDDLPSGLQVVGRPWSDAALIEIAYSYEQATHHRHPPGTVPPLN